MKLGKDCLPGYELAVGGVLLAAGVVGLGAFTRLVDAGLGCPDWPGCYGHLLWPNDAQEIEAANTAFPDMPVIAGKPWPEMVHRYFAGILGLLIFAQTIFAIKNRRDDSYPFRQTIFMAVLVIWQALFGMWTVTLKLWPQVVTIHLLGGFLTFVLLTVLVQRLSTYRWSLTEHQFHSLFSLRGATVLGLVLVFLQIMLGGWLASNYAAFGCPDFPKCTGEWWPEMDVKSGFNIFQDIGPNYLGGLLGSDARTAIHFVHRLGAILTLVYLIYLGCRILAVKIPQARTLVIGLWVILLIQVGLGISNVLYLIPLWNAVAHNLVGALLLATLAALLTQINRANLVGAESQSDG